ncbi:hypothetical protein B0T26DRAFT_691595 [Lasiosphaeria miniovina]|uniref:Fungal N-terminal domain-containing protein n=1 Tax=Lasiosphaeria miniovina TaxID=1954250 RepID=A0AA40B322_9PEZI|nr:uncharacterized protein B0T26DRAFT_691595 [Lasiosphaeria miniovina]KAK0726746.1 hypothetical protein B0T26DRAFT_691595 [Lasiosphaeria miniovina]
MDPLSVTASIAGIAGVCIQAASLLDTLRSKIQNAHITITALSSQCRAIKTGLSQLQTLILQNHAIRDQPDVILTLDTTLTGCLVVLTCFEDLLDKLCDRAVLMGSRRSLARMWWSRTRIAWNESEMKDYLSLLQGQQSAVAFLVQVLHMNSIDEILESVRNGKDLLNNQTTRAESVRYANPQLQIADSVLGSRHTADTIFQDRNTVAEGVEFEFDNAVVNSKAYRRVVAMATKVITKRGTGRPKSIMNLENTSFDSKAQSLPFIMPISQSSDGRKEASPSVSPLPSTKSEAFESPPPSPGILADKTSGEDANGLRAPQGAATILVDALRIRHGQIGAVYDIDYFDMRCQKLLSAVIQWVLRFSKFSDMRSSRLSSELNDEKLIDRLEDSILDGSDVDTYLADRVKRRDIFTSMIMTMIWEFVFTRYLFGMDREERQKLKVLEKQLSGVGPPEAIRAWRATTLSLLSNRPSFKNQREQDTHAVTAAILEELAKILPPPLALQDQIQMQLHRVICDAVELSILMRTQLAEYVMLPPLRPEYDDTGELVEVVSFNAALMSQLGRQRKMEDLELEHEGAVVRIVLFPLVVRKGDQEGEGEDEVVVRPAQVLVQPKATKELVRTIEVSPPSSQQLS